MKIKKILETWNRHLVKIQAMSEKWWGQLQADLQSEHFKTPKTKEDLLLLLVEEIRPTSWYVIYPIIYMVLHIPGG